MSEKLTYRHPVTNRVKTSTNALYMERAGFEPWDGEVEVDKVGVQTAAMSHADLQQLAVDNGLSKSGSKAELQARLAAKAAEPAPANTDSSGDKSATDSSSTSAGETK